jgi:hypothetical protein
MGITSFMRRASDVEPLDVPTLVTYRVDIADNDPLKLASRLYEIIDYPRALRELAGHVSGVSEDGVEFISVWADEQAADNTFKYAMAELAVLWEEFPGLQFERETYPVHRFVVTEGAEEYDADRALPNPSCAAYRLDVPIHGRNVYDRACELMNFPDDLPDGLLMHVAAETADGWTTYTVWHSVEDAREYMRDQIMPAGLQIVRDQQIFPEIRPVEIVPTLFASNPGILALT